VLNVERRALGGAAVAIACVATITMTAASPAQAWLHLGMTTTYPAEGGKWEYGFENAKVRSYYTQPNTTHGSSVVYNGSLTRSICTAAGHKSIAEAWALNYPGATDAYYYRIC
jgi:Bacteriocin (Lactococcin_972)